MNQLYVQRFEAKNPDKEAFDKCWDIANKAFKETGNWGNVPSGIKTHYALVTAWGGYVVDSLLGEFAGQYARSFEIRALLPEIHRLGDGGMSRCECLLFQ